MKELNLREIQQAELENLKYLNNLCRSQHVTYYLAYGTLLGAVRHHGFIPWDDDTDIWMPRKDYEKFLAYCEEHVKEITPFKLCTRENTKNYPYGIARFCDQRYKYVTINPSERKFELGVFTDIYPLDNCGNDNAQPMKQLFNYCDKLNYSYLRYSSGLAKNKFKSFLKKIMYVYLHLIHGENYAQKVDKKILQAIENSTSESDKYIGVPAWDPYFMRYRKSDFKDIILVDFEGNQFSIPKGYDNILTRNYGDYMQFPPKSERHPYHGYKIYKK